MAGHVVIGQKGVQLLHQDVTVGVDQDGRERVDALFAGFFSQPEAFTQKINIAFGMTHGGVSLLVA